MQVVLKMMLMTLLAQAKMPALLILFASNVFLGTAYL
jgi:hypothetical protein